MSVYGTWTGEKGNYTDVVARVGQFDTDVDSYGDYPDKASYKNRAYSLSVEYGKRIELSKERGTFIEPQAQLIIGRLGSNSYITDRGTAVAVEGMNSAIARLGVVAGKKSMTAVTFISKCRPCMNLLVNVISVCVRLMAKFWQAAMIMAIPGLNWDLAVT